MWGNTHDQERTLRRINALKSTPLLTRCRRSLPVRNAAHTGGKLCDNPCVAWATRRHRAFSESWVFGQAEVHGSTKVHGGNSVAHPWKTGKAGGMGKGQSDGAGQPVTSVRWRNDKRAADTERYQGWRRGESSEGRNPKGGCGMKQGHQVREGANR